MTFPTRLPPMPVIDAREGGVLQHAREGTARAGALRDACLASFPAATRPLLPVIEAVSRRWLMRSHSPYLAEISAIAGMLEGPGAWCLNASYQWGCTTLAREEQGVPWLARTLDWPFPGLGRGAEVVHLRGPAGNFYSVTWPGYVGALTAMAPGRFAAAINQAPMRRRTRHPYLRLYDFAANAVNTYRHVRHMPPDQLLRQAFETCRTFVEARALLETVPVARPVIFTLAGCARGEAAVIERTEEGFQTREDETGTANDWLQRRDGWEGRIAGDLLFRCSTEQAAENSRARRAALLSFDCPFAAADFSWIVPPVLNRYTRIGVVLCPARGLLRAVGYEAGTPGALPQPVTEVAAVDAALEAA